MRVMIMKQDLLADCMSIIKNSENIGKKECLVPVSKLIKNVLDVIKKHKYIEDYENLGRKFKVKLNHRINNCGVIKPRFSVKNDEFEKWKKRYLPAQGFGILILSTNKGIKDHREIEEKGLGGKLLCYVY